MLLCDVAKVTLFACVQNALARTDKLLLDCIKANPSVTSIEDLMEEAVVQSLEPSEAHVLLYGNNASSRSGCPLLKKCCRTANVVGINSTVEATSRMGDDEISQGETSQETAQSSIFDLLGDY